MNIKATMSGRTRAGTIRQLAGAPGFTLMEVLVAVAGLAVLAVGVAAIFDTTGRTVRAGRSVSNFAGAAALIEQQLRQDIESMTRDGFLVIRNQYAAAGPTATPYMVRLHEQDSSGGRPRRIDELMFFSKGTYRSARELLVPGIVAESDTARVYYGHGARLKRSVFQGLWQTPEIDAWHEGTSNEPDAVLGLFDPANPGNNPNAFASSWILLRHITLLAPHRVTQSTPTAPPGAPAWYGSLGNRRDNSDVQVALQPAASNMFRSLNARFPSPVPASIRSDERPTFINGMIDIATTDLTDIRNIVTTADTWPSSFGANFFDPAANQSPDGNNAGPDGLWRIYGDAPWDTQIVGRMHAWMDDAMPAHSMGTVAARSLTRVRCENAPTNYVGSVIQNGAAQYAPVPDKDLRRADQLMLTAHNFLPSCTEFIVEWSMGQTIPNDNSHPNHIAGREGEVIWYGMRRDVNGTVVAAPYDIGNAASTPWRLPIQVPFTRVDGGRELRTVPNDATGEVNLIHGNVAIAQPNNAVSSYFGWDDPTFDPEDPFRVGGTNGAANGVLDLPAESASPTLEWPWPKLIRVTISLADPNNPAIEQTFQFVFDVPAARAQ